MNNRLHLVYLSRRLLLLTLFILIIPSISLANKVANQGENISADKINSSISQIGDIKQSILSVEKFQQIHGNCWVRMEGQSITGSDLAILEPTLGTLPNTTSGGVFLRQATSSRVLGSYESDALQDHRHTVPAGNGAYNAQTGALSNQGTSYTSYVNTADGARVASETRPKNIAVNFFIKINKQCNFN